MKPTIRVETLAIGDELLTGKIADTNSAWVGSELFRVGIRLDQTTTIADDFASIKTSLDELSNRAQHVVVFGGLGPTTDDKTVEAVAQWLGCAVDIHEPSREKLAQLYKVRGRQINSHTLRQVRYPADCTAYPNSVGMAPGFSCTKSGCTFYFLPGVQQEMKALFSEFIFDQICAAQPQQHMILSKQWNCMGVAESDLQAAVYDTEQSLPEGCWLGFRTSFPENHLTLYCQGESSKKQFAEFCQTFSKIVEPWCYSDDGRSLEQVTVELLVSKKLSVALAESCTGGLVGQRLSRISGASEVLWGSMTTYQLAAKDTLLGVKVADENEAVSSACSNQLATHTLKLSGCSIAAAITGWAGPLGGTKEDPVGTIYTCAVSSSGQAVESRSVLHWKSRTETQWAAASHLLHSILQLAQ